MECVVDKLQAERAQQLSQILDVEENDRSVVAHQVQQLKETFEELELAAAAATAEPTSPVLNAALYSEYLLVVLLSKNLYVKMGHCLAQPAAAICAELSCAGQ